MACLMNCSSLESLIIPSKALIEKVVALAIPKCKVVFSDEGECNP